MLNNFKMKMSHSKILATITLLASILNNCQGMTQYPKSDLHPSCKVEIQDGEMFFRRELRTKQPHFVQFKIRQVGNEMYSVSKNVFEPFRWSWTTFMESEGPYPFILWNIDYGILSFGILETNSLYMEQEVVLNVSDDCHLTYGSHFTTMAIVNAFIPLVNESFTGADSVYKENYFCYYQNNPKLSRIESIEYNCTSVYFNDTSNLFMVKPACIECLPRTYTWLKNKTIPLVIYFCFMLFGWPILMLNFAIWLEKYENIENPRTDHAPPEEIVLSGNEINDYDNTDWLYSDGINYPITLSDAFHSAYTFVFIFFTPACCIENVSKLVKRFKRIMFLLPISFYLIQCFMYKRGFGLWDTDDKITVKMLIENGIYMGSLSLLYPGSWQYWFNVGAITTMVLLSIIVFVFPSSLKQKIENGIPHVKDLPLDTILCPTFKQTLKYSNVRYLYHCGYEKALVLIKCRFFSLFTSEFWMDVQKIWKKRSFGEAGEPKANIKSVFYIIVGFFELLLHVWCFCIPLMNMLDIIRRGFKIRGRIFFVIIFVLYLFLYFMIYMYFDIVYYFYQMVRYFFIALILYPQVSFQWLSLLSAVLVTLKLSQTFSDVYMDFLIKTIKVAKEVHEEDVQVHREIFREKGGFFGIPKPLFNILRKQFRPYNELMFPLLVNTTFIIMCMYALANLSATLTNGPTKELSDMMGLIAMLIAGFLPKLISVLSSHSHDAEISAIEERQIKRVIYEYKRDEGEDSV